jgi:hypothetical protein
MPELAPVPADLFAGCSVGAAASPFKSRSRIVRRRPVLETPKATHTALLSCSESESARYAGVARREREIARRIASALRRSASNSRSCTSCLSELQPKTPSIAFFNLACFIDDSQNASFRNRMLLRGSRKSHGTRRQ